MAHPGVSFTVLKSVLNLNDSTLRYHLNFLEKSKKISFGLEKGRRYYYPYSGGIYIVRNGENSNTFSAYDLTRVQESILTTIKRYPKINQKELVKRTGINRITVSNNLKKLMVLCLVRKIPNGNKIQYEYIENKQLRYEILKRLIMELLNNEIDEETFLEMKRELD